MPELIDRTDAIDALDDAQFLSRIDEIRTLGPRTRAHAAWRWAKIMRPSDPKSMKDEAFKRFTLLRD